LDKKLLKIHEAITITNLITTMKGLHIENI